MSKPKSFFRSLPKLLATILGSLAAIGGIVGTLYTTGVIGPGKVPEDKKEVGIEIKGGEIHAGRDVIGIQKIGTATIVLTDEQFAKVVEILQNNLQTVPNEKTIAKIEDLRVEEEIGTKDAEKAEALVAAGNKSLELGKKHLEDREFKHATREFRDALKYLPASSEAAGDVYINLASAYAYQYKWDDALEAYKQAEQIGKELDNKQLLALAYGGTGTIYYSVSKNDKALEYYEKALAITRELGDRQGEGVTLHNIGSIYDTLGKHNKALEYFEHALAIRREVGDKPGEGITIWYIATIFEKQGRTQGAVDNLEEVVRIDKATNNPDMAQDIAYLVRLKRTLKKHDSQ
ncbi:MAG: tetratricopeptide repeat protein [Planctomycetota bacterium]|jgi:tetratricopeptide (TPR) repeat protein